MSSNRRAQSALADYLHGSRRRILRCWHSRVCHDPELITVRSLSFAQFTDSIPKVLDAFEQWLRTSGARAGRAAQELQRQGASAHGLNRWQQGFALREITREWTHLHCCLLRYLEHYARRRRGEAATLRLARGSLARTCGDGASESVECYARLKEDEASARTRDLLAAVAELQQAAQLRGEVLRQAAHDLRGSVGIISNVTGSLGRIDSDTTRMHALRTLDRAVAATRSLLTDLLDLTRLEAGDDQLQLHSLDASALLRELAESLRAEAAARALFLKLEGPASLPVRTDATKLKRIVQNLVLNAIKVTQRGGVTIRWCVAPDNPEQWALEIIDTGPGLDGTSASPIVEALLRATRLRRAREAESGLPTELPCSAGPAGEQSAVALAAAPAAPPSADGTGGEGIGLAIVKRLCDLLGAGIELESGPPGSTFRIQFPLVVHPHASTLV
jgi:signal transduction histidine kinase